MKKRNSLAVLVVYASDGILDGYIVYLAEKMKESVKTLIITVNGNMNDDGLERLSFYSDSVFVRDNSGYDYGAYKETIENFIGWERLRAYDELILLNDSCYGPVYPMEEVFEAMDGRSLDFWGITEQPPIRAGDYTDRLLPYHIQTYFICVGTRMLRSDEFREFWKEAKTSDGYRDTVYNFELKFTQYFQSLGYKPGAYIDAKKFCETEDETQAYVFFNSYRLVAKERCPFLKKKVFSFPHKEVLASNQGETAGRVVRYLDRFTEYDVTYIYENLIHKNNIIDLWLALHLDFCIPEGIKPVKKKKLGILCFPGSNERHRLTESFSENTELIFFYVQEKEINREAFCAWLQNCDFFYFLSDSSEPANADAVIELFYSHPYLGMLCSPIPISEEAEGMICPEIYNQEAQEIADSLGLDICLDLQKKGFLYGKNVWFRKEAVIGYLEQEIFCQGLYKCYTREDETFRWFPLIYPYLAQKKGFYSGRVLSSNSMSERIGEYRQKLSRIVKDRLVYRGVKEFRNVRRVNQKLIHFCRKYNALYIYGAGGIGNECFIYLKMHGIRVRGFVVSDGKRNDFEISKARVWELSELTHDENNGFIIAVNRTDRDGILETLGRKGITSVACYEE
ncbi:MAG: hypothetical protein HFG82_03535 [Dorea sp.]|nr:hypothetical protein [Dorea sp.]